MAGTILLCLFMTNLLIGIISMKLQNVFDSSENSNYHILLDMAIDLETIYVLFRRQGNPTNEFLVYATTNIDLPAEGNDSVTDLKVCELEKKFDSVKEQIE